MSSAIVLLSGGIDSATALFLMREKGWDLYSLTFDYAQGSKTEIPAALMLASRAGVKEHFTVELPFFREIQSRSVPAPEARSVVSAYVPARNTIFYAVAAAFAETLGANAIVSGSTFDDIPELPDAKPGFVKLMNEVLRVGTKGGVENRAPEIILPLSNLPKKDVLKEAIRLKIPLEITWSCYEDVLIACGTCRGCVNRRRVFAELKLQDPIRYQS